MPLLKENIVFGTGFKISYPKPVTVHAAVHPVFKAPENFTGSSVFTQCGKFVSIVALKPKVDSVVVDAEFGQQLAYHVIGMNPTSLYPSKDADVESSEELEQSQSDVTASVEEPETPNKADEDEYLPDQHEIPNESNFDNSSNALVEQNFLFAPEKSVGQICEELQAEIVDFHRFELK